MSFSGQNSPWLALLGHRLFFQRTHLKAKCWKNALSPLGPKDCLKQKLRVVRAVMQIEAVGNGKGNHTCKQTMGSGVGREGGEGRWGRSGKQPRGRLDKQSWPVPQQHNVHGYPKCFRLKKTHISHHFAFYSFRQNTFCEPNASYAVCWFIQLLVKTITKTGVRFGAKVSLEMAQTGASSF